MLQPNTLGGCTIGIYMDEVKIFFHNLESANELLSKTGCEFVEHLTEAANEWRDDPVGFLFAVCGEENLTLLNNQGNFVTLEKISYDPKIPKTMTFKLYGRIHTYFFNSNQNLTNLFRDLWSTETKGHINSILGIEEI